MLNIEVNTNNLNIALRRFPSELKFELADALDHISRSFFKEFGKNTQVKMKPRGLFHRFRRVLRTTKGSKLLDIHGSQSETTKIIAENTDSAFDMKLEIFTRSKVAKIQEEGGVISASGGHGMAIPLNKTAENLDIGMQAASYKLSNLGLIPVKLGDSFFLARKRGKKQLELLFILRNKIRIHPNLRFYDSWDKMAGKRTKYLNEAVTRAIKNT